MAKQSKNPWIAAILNFIIWGVGYIYVGKRVGFGIFLLIIDLISISFSFYSWSALLIWAVPLLLLSVAFAYDGYKTAEEVNQEK